MYTVSKDAKKKKSIMRRGMIVRRQRFERVPPKVLVEAA